MKGDCLNQNSFCGAGFSLAGLKLGDERDRVESVADQSQTENMAGAEYLKALQTEWLRVHVCGDHTARHVCVYHAGCA